MCFLQAKLAKQGESIDKIYIIASKSVKKEVDFFYNGKEMCVSHVELFKKRLEDTIGIQGEQFEYIDYDEDEPVDTNMKALLALADQIREKDGDQDDAKVHFDMTGGLRTVTQMMTSLLYLLKHSKVNIGHVLYSDYSKNTVDDMSELFYINTLVAGIEEFTNYGSTRSLQAYFKADHTDVTTMSESCYQLIEVMKAFSIAVSLCIPYEMIKAIKVLKEAIVKVTTKRDVDNILKRLGKEMPKLYEFICDCIQVWEWIEAIKANRSYNLYSAQGKRILC